MFKKSLPWLLAVLVIVLLAGCSGSTASSGAAGQFRGQQPAGASSSTGVAGGNAGGGSNFAGRANGQRQGNFSGFAGRRATATAEAAAASGQVAAPQTAANASPSDQNATPVPAANTQSNTAMPAAAGAQPAAGATETATGSSAASTTSPLGTPTDVLKSGTVLTTTAAYAGPDASSSQLGPIDAGATLIVTRALGDWYEFIYNESGVAHAWLPKADVSLASTDAAAPTPAAAAIAAAPAKTTTAPAGKQATTATSTSKLAASAAAPTGARLAGKLVFQNHTGGTIYLMNADGTGLRTLTTGIEPVLSPDGTQVAFTRWQDDQKGLWLINSDGSNEHKVIGAERPRSPTWSTDGKVITFERTVESKTCRKTPWGCLTNEELQARFGGKCTTDRGRTMCIDDFPVVSYNYTNLTSIDLASGALHDLPASDTAAAPSQSPTQNLVVHLDENGLAAAFTKSGDQPQRLVDLPGLLGPATYSPDGQYLYASRKSGDHWDIWRWKADGSQAVALTSPPLLRDHPVNSVSPAPSPDGKSIVFLTDRQGKWELWVMNADGSNQRPLASAALTGVTFQYDANNERMVDWGK